ncbi:MAG: N-6 DNA methylase [Atopobiaceae bacterium]|jgi:type I restriction enzyme M protein|nr:N-6 DNA methylase [Atopobiaceae bacterium]
MNIEPLMERLSNEYGYRIPRERQLVHSVGINREKLSFFSANQAVFFVVYSLEGTLCSIDELFRSAYTSSDDDCSLFAINHNEILVFYQRSPKNGQFSEIPKPVYYKPLNNRTLFEGTLDEKAEGLFFEAHSILRDFDGMHPDEALDELCKVIYVKLFDESRQSAEDASFLASSYGNAEELAASVRKLYREANEKSFGNKGISGDSTSRQTGIFSDSIKASSVALSRIVHLFENYNFTNSDIDIKARAFQRVYAPAMRSGMGQYFTPLNVIRFIVSAVSPSLSDEIIDPFSGSGHFLAEAVNEIRKRGIDDTALINYVQNNLHGIEKSERMARIAATDFQLYCGASANVSCCDALLPFDAYINLREESYDIVITNPPFGSVLQSDSFAYLGEFDLMRNRARVPLEVLGLERSVQLLKPGGRLGIVLPDSIFANKTNAYVRSWIAENLDVFALVGLPLATFMPFGANIKTSILFARKKALGDYSFPDQVFTAQIDDIGHDSRGRSTTDEDWKQVLSELQIFLEGCD